MKKMVFVVVLLGCLNFLYFGVQYIAGADGFDDLALIGSIVAPANVITDDDTELDYESFFRNLKDMDQTPAEIELERKIDRILDKYPAKIVDLDHKRRFLTIEISGWMTKGTDTACIKAAQCFHSLTSLGLILKVQGEWVPSQMNPMDRHWTAYLLEKLYQGRLRIRAKST